MHRHVTSNLALKDEDMLGGALRDGALPEYTLPGGGALPSGGAQFGGGALPGAGALPGGGNLPAGGNPPGGEALPGRGTLPDGEALSVGWVLPGGGALPNEQAQAVRDMVARLLPQDAGRFKIEVDPLVSDDRDTVSVSKLNIYMHLIKYM